ncbi:unnamed protein product [Alopecurus aequalis]
MEKKFLHSSLLPLLLLSCFFSPYFVHSIGSSTPGSGCSNSNISIPYPFGVPGQNPSPAQGFNIMCGLSGPMLPIGNSVFGIIDISLLDGSVSILAPATSRSHQCGGNYTSFSLEETNFTFSDTRNKFAAVGCNMVSMLLNGTSDYSSGCASFCSSKNSIANGSCDGVACCQAPVPKGLKKMSLEFTSLRLNKDRGTSECAEAFIVEQNSYVFSTLDLDISTSSSQYRPVVLEWSIDGGSCEEANRSASYACKENSYCYNSSNGIGYRCSCTDGFQGNPYLQAPGGCQDIDECSIKRPCSRICINTEGSFHCTCPSGMIGDGYKDGTGCQRNSLLLGIIIGLSCGFGVLLLTFSAVLLARRWKKNVQKQLRTNYFLKNQGLLLQKLVSSDETANDKTTIFSIEELEKATNNFDPTRIIGHGGHGMVYKGILSDQRVAAIKKSTIVKECEISQFINEVAVLTQTNHRNIVKLFGCCLETEVPLLVYDYVSSGSLSEVLHTGANSGPSLSWGDYIRIAMETAGALSYLHSSASISIFHRDEKSSNILLDGNYTTKVSDFGASRLVPIDQTHVITNVQGTFGYLDPEYFRTRQLNEKSDVYSFGVVLVELLLRMKPVFKSESGTIENLSNYFLQEFKEGRITSIVNSQVLEEATEEEINGIASLAEQCLRLSGEERPTMKQVETELQTLRTKQMSSCQAEPRNEERMRPRSLTRRTRSVFQSSETELGARVGLQSGDSQRCYTLEGEFMSSASLPR